MLAGWRGAASSLAIGALLLSGCGGSTAAPPAVTVVVAPPTTAASATAVPIAPTAATPSVAPTAAPSPSAAPPTATVAAATATPAPTAGALPAGSSLRPPTLPPLGPTAAPTVAPAPSPTAAPSPAIPGDWRAFAHPSGRWQVQYPADLLRREDLGDGLTIFISQDRTTFLAVDSLVADGAFYGNTGEGLRNRARDALDRIYGQPPRQVDIAEATAPWEANLTFATALGSTGQALYEQRGRRLGDYDVLGVIVGYKAANAATAGPLVGAVFDTLVASQADPFRYCAHAVAGTPAGPIGEFAGPARYTGPAQPFPGPRGAPLAWRCADGKVFGCEPDGGAMCLRLNVSREPAPALVDHCRRNPDAAPPAALVADSVFEWTCRGGAPTIVRQRVPFDQIDKHGYLVGPWREIGRP